MKIIFTSLIFLILYSNSFGQITTRTIAEKPVSKPRVYDSLTAFNPKEDLRIYIGQELFFLPKSKKWENFKESDIIGYSDFSNAPTDAGNIEKYQYHPLQNGKYNFVSNYKQIAGKYFIIDDFIDQTDRNKFKYNEQGLYFKLVNKELRDTAYYQIAKVKQHLSDRMIIPFVILGNFEKEKTLLLGKKLQLQETIENVKEINTGQFIAIEKDSWWECVDFSLVDLEKNIYSKPVFIFKNEKNQEIAVEANGYNALLNVKRNQFLTPKEIEEQKRQKEIARLKEEERLRIKEEEKRKREAEWAENNRKFRQDCINEFGAKYGNYIADGKVIIGMTKKMCRTAWGNPYSINTTTTKYGQREQWVYSLKHYLYFENDKLTAIQN
ncbi:MAG: hypothetical protein LC105_12180 [Chitinophagales bacterium]|nr:hypothetical protein [Chitinophagales bacterium]